MAITEQNRHHLHQRLADVLGDDEAATLMAHLPPVGWADVATKHDIDRLAVDIDRLSADIDKLAVATKHDIEQSANVLEARFGQQLAEGLRTQFIQVIGCTATLLGIATVVNHLWR